MSHNHIHHTGDVNFDLILMLLFLFVFVLYIVAAALSNRHHKPWPWSRYVFWLLGVLSAAMAVVGPLPDLAHTNFTAHMIGHLLLGMLSPLLLAHAAPIRLLLRTLSLQSSRYLSGLLKSEPFRIVRDPFVASILNVGGLYLLYTTDLYQMMHQISIVHILVHTHVFLAGYLFTISMIYPDISPHRTSYAYRTIALVFALAGHDILSKYIYSNPPVDVPVNQAEIGGMLMYYGGDAIDIIIIIILCYQWYRASRPRKTVDIDYNIFLKNT